MRTCSRLEMFALRLRRAAVAGACEQRDVRVLPAFSQQVRRLKPVRTSAQLGGRVRRELIARGEKHLRAEGLHQRAPAFVAPECRA
jgi:hypothetical protein